MRNQKGLCYGSCREIAKLFLPMWIRKMKLFHWITDVLFFADESPQTLDSRAAVHSVEFWWIYVWMWVRQDWIALGKYLRPVLNGIKSISIQLTSFPNWFLVDCSINNQLFPIFTTVHSMRSARKIVSGINQTRFVHSNYEAIVIETAPTWNINFHPLLSPLSPSILAGAPFTFNWMLSASKWSLKENFPIVSAFNLFTFEGEV